ncbi:MAG: ATP-binding cassette domain-containing protein [Firmicutes bacterium]|nr:ATP-binding cassette domain-containing protein [Bacillota bacterium]MBQ1887496.1 ATP-binding cassette domain-containing protein [Bacillota bacterium]
MADNNLQPLLEVKDLSMHFVNGKRRKQSIVKAVDHVSFDIYPGETFGMVGESGCGKTTCGRTIIRLYDPTGGQLFYKGVEISGKMTRDKRKYITENIAMVFQDPIASLNPRMTVQEIIGEGLKIRGMEDPAEREKVVVDMLERVGLQKEHATRYPHEFSGGQRQRIGIARALVVKPSMIIADEPVSALDVSVQAQVINLLNDLKEEFGLTIMFIAHNLSVVKYFCDRIAVMYFGKLVELATSDELFAHPCHPYTRALLSAIPLPDPLSEKTRVRLSYEPPKNRDESLLSYHTVAEGHTVLCTDEEFEEIMKNY